MSYSRYRYKQYRQSNPRGGSILGWLAVAAGGYLVLDYMGIVPSLSQMFGGTTTTIPTTSGTTVQGNTQQVATATTQSATNTTNTNPTASNTLALVTQEMAAYGQDPTKMWSADVWNYYYNMVNPAGVTAPPHEVLFPNDPNDTGVYTAEVWWAAMSSKGFNGLAGVANYGNQYGLGTVVRTNPFMPGIGNGVLPLASETFIKWLQ